MSLLVTEHLTKRYGGLLATNDVSLTIEATGLHALIGPNGAGKSTLVGQLCGETRPTSGRIFLRGEDITGLAVEQVVQRGVVRSYQITSIFRDFTALENVAFGVQARQGHSFDVWRPARTDPRLNEPALGYLARCGLAERAGVQAGDLAHGEQRQLEVAMALSTGAPVLLLDEPMAGMGAAEASRMIELLRDLKAERSVLLVEHDMDAVFALADTISVLVNGRIVASGDPAEIGRSALVREAYLGEASPGEAPVA